MRLYRAIALSLAIVFGAVGLVFLCAPAAVIALFDHAAGAIGWPAMPAAYRDAGLFRALAVGYMYVVTLLAWMMFRRPAEPTWPALLAHAKLASAAVSLVLFIAYAGGLALVTNAVVDGGIGLAAVRLTRWSKALRRPEPAAQVTR